MNYVFSFEIVSLVTQNCDVLTVLSFVSGFIIIVLFYYHFYYLMKLYTVLDSKLSYPKLYLKMFDGACLSLCVSTPK